MVTRLIKLTLTPVLIISIFAVAGLVIDFFDNSSIIYAVRANVTASNPVVVDAELDVQLYFSGLKRPTSMIFLGPEDVLVTQKNEGTVERIVNRTQSLNPLVIVPAASKDERGLLGKAISKDQNGSKTKVFLYYTEKGANKSDVLGNRIYKYELNENATQLTNGTLLLDLPWEPGPRHNGGVLKIGPDNNIYVTIGDVMRTGHNESQLYETQMQNLQNGKEADGRAGILRITQSGLPVSDGIIDSRSSLNLYYAYGIKNSFGIDFDPVTGKLWDTENGPTFGDEINLVEPGFNSGWKQIQGVWNVNTTLDKQGIAPTNPEGLVDFDSKGKYSTPEFTWDKSVAPTALTFLDTDKLGIEY